MGTIVRTSALISLQTGLITQFAAGYTSPSDAPLYPQLTSEISSTKKNVLVALADMMPQMREWLGNRVYHAPAEHSQLISNPHYELSLAVDADDVADDELGSYFLSAQALGDRAAMHPDILLASVLQAGTTTLGFDGQNFFDTDHPVNVKAGTGSQSNYSASGKALTAANWESVRATMASWTAGPSGELIGSRPTHVIVPRQLEGTARRIFEAELDASTVATAAQSNVNRGAAKVIVWDRLNNEPTAWYPVDLRGILKPWIYVSREKPKFIMRNRPDDSNMFEDNLIKFGVDGRFGIGQGAWFRAYKAVA